MGFSFGLARSPPRSIAFGSTRTLSRSHSAVPQLWPRQAAPPVPVARRARVRCAGQRTFSQLVGRGPSAHVIWAGPRSVRHLARRQARCTLPPRLTPVGVSFILVGFYPAHRSNLVRPTRAVADASPHAALQVPVAPAARAAKPIRWAAPLHQQE